MNFIKKSGISNSENLLIYENGELLKNTEFSHTASMNLEDTPIQIGRMWQFENQNRTLNGIIYSVRIYNRVLSDDEIKQNYEVDKKRFNIN